MLFEFTSRPRVLWFYSDSITVSSKQLHKILSKNMKEQYSQMEIVMNCFRNCSKRSFLNNCFFWHVWSRKKGLRCSTLFLGSSRFEKDQSCLHIASHDSMVPSYDQTNRELRNQTVLAISMWPLQSIRNRRKSYEFGHIVGTHSQWFVWLLFEAFFYIMFLWYLVAIPKMIPKPP